jgi:hypothetical protein
MSVLSVIDRFRARGLSDPLTTTTLEQIGIKPSTTSFTLRTLVFLGLIDESGNITPAFHQLRQAPENDYPNSLAEIIRKAYLRVFTVADPATDDGGKITDAFRVYEPANQREKMIRLFMGLCEKAGIVPPGSVRQQKSTPRRGITRNNPNAQHPKQETPAAPPPSPPTSSHDALHLSLEGLVNDLPNRGKNWTQTERERWLAAFTYSLDYAYPAKEEPTKQNSRENMVADPTNAYHHESQ